MSGHSKWHNIQHRKGLQDAKRGKIFTKLIREITSAARVGGGDPAGNPRLRAAIAEALSNNMTRDTVERAVKRGAGGEGDGAQLETLTYEGYGPAGIAIMVECMPDNKNRTVADVRHVFTRYGGNLGNSGSVSYLFNKRGVFSFDQGDEDKLMEVALDAGADDVVANDDGSVDVYSTPEAFGAVLDALEAASLKPDSSRITMVPTTETELDAENGAKLMHIVDALDDLDDVQQVYHNGSISDEVAAQIEASEE